MRRPDLPLLFGTASLLLSLSGCHLMQEPTLVLEEPSSTQTQPLAAPHAAALSRMSPDELQAEYARADKRHANRPSVETGYELGLVVGQWGHAHFSPGRAAQLLDEAGSRMATEGGWSPADIAFLEFQSAQLRYIDARLALLRGSRQENEQMQQRLRQAEEKLRAIADIERSLTDSSESAR
ncbi:MAG: hypothetical protein CMN28_14165 [Salinisphaeraceae bacterium]|jgi:hypothetical protein|nr:hypothetical protein [Salinisphaeraceae bacterium]